MSSVSEEERSLKQTVAKLTFLITQLPKQHQENFQSCYTETDLLNAVEKLNAFKHGRTHARRLNHFIENTKPFFAALDVICQIDTVHFATVWGGIRVIIQVRSSF